MICVIEGLLKYGGSVWLILRIVDNVLIVYDVRGRRKFRFECRCNCLVLSVVIDNVLLDFVVLVFGFEDYRRNC